MTNWLPEDPEVIPLVTSNAKLYLAMLQFDGVLDLGFHFTIFLLLISDRFLKMVLQFSLIHVFYLEQVT